MNEMDVDEISLNQYVSKTDKNFSSKDSISKYTFLLLPEWSGIDACRRT